MAELTNLESKLAEVIGLAQAAQGATDKVKGLLEDQPEISERLDQMHAEAVETEERGTAFAESLDGKKTAILDAARETKTEATEMMSTYLGEDSDELDGFEFLTMAEAGEVGHWEILGQLNEQAGDQELQELVDWALPIQKQHLETVRTSSLDLAKEEDALAPA
jgi:hypothetical protein